MNKSYPNKLKNNYNDHYSNINNDALEILSSKYCVIIDNSIRFKRNELYDILGCNDHNRQYEKNHENSGQSARFIELLNSNIVICQYSSIRSYKVGLRRLCKSSFFTIPLVFDNKDIASWYWLVVRTAESNGSSDYISKSNYDFLQFSELFYRNLPETSRKNCIILKSCRLLDKLFNNIKSDSEISNSIFHYSLNAKGQNIIHYVFRVYSKYDPLKYVDSDEDQLIDEKSILENRLHEQQVIGQSIEKMGFVASEFFPFHQFFNGTNYSTLTELKIDIYKSILVLYSDKFSLSALSLISNDSILFNQLNGSRESFSGKSLPNSNVLQNLIWNRCHSTPLNFRNDHIQIGYKSYSSLNCDNLTDDKYKVSYDYSNHLINTDYVHSPHNLSFNTIQSFESDNCCYHKNKIRDNAYFFNPNKNPNNSGYLEQPQPNQFINENREIMCYYTPKHSLAPYHDNNSFQNKRNSHHYDKDAVQYDNIVFKNNNPNNFGMSQHREVTHFGDENIYNKYTNLNSYQPAINADGCYYNPGYYPSHIYISPNGQNTNFYNEMPLDQSKKWNPLIDQEHQIYHSLDHSKLLYSINILQLIDSYPTHEIPLNMIPTLYLNRFNANILPIKHEYKDVRDFLNTIPNIYFIWIYQSFSSSIYKEFKKLSKILSCPKKQIIQLIKQSKVSTYYPVIPNTQVYVTSRNYINYTNDEEIILALVGNWIIIHESDLNKLSESNTLKDRNVKTDNYSYIYLKYSDLKNALNYIVKENPQGGILNELLRNNTITLKKLHNMSYLKLKNICTKFDDSSIEPSYRYIIYLKNKTKIPISRSFVMDPTQSSHIMLDNTRQIYLQRNQVYENIIRTGKTYQPIPPIVSDVSHEQDYYSQTGNHYNMHITNLISRVFELISVICEWKIIRLVSLISDIKLKDANKIITLEDLKMVSPKYLLSNECGSDKDCSTQMVNGSAKMHTEFNEYSLNVISDMYKSRENDLTNSLVLENGDNCVKLEMENDSNISNNIDDTSSLTIKDKDRVTLGSNSNNKNNNSLIPSESELTNILGLSTKSKNDEFKEQYWKLGVNVSALIFEWSNYYSTSNPLHYYLKRYNFSKLKQLLVKIPNIYLEGDEGFFSIYTKYHLQRLLAILNQYDCLYLMKSLTPKASHLTYMKDNDSNFQATTYLPELSEIDIQKFKTKKNFFNFIYRYNTITASRNRMLSLVKPNYSPNIENMISFKNLVASFWELNSDAVLDILKELIVLLVSIVTYLQYNMVNRECVSIVETDITHFKNFYNMSLTTEEINHLIYIHNLGLSGFKLNELSTKWNIFFFFLSPFTAVLSMAGFRDTDDLLFINFIYRLKDDVQLFIDSNNEYIIVPTNIHSLIKEIKNSSDSIQKIIKNRYTNILKNFYTININSYNPLAA